MKFCTNCGAQMEDGAKFCTECGQKFQQSAPQTPVAESAPEQVTATHMTTTAETVAVHVYGQPVSHNFTPPVNSDCEQSAVHTYGATVNHSFAPPVQTQSALSGSYGGVTADAQSPATVPAQPQTEPAPQPAPVREPVCAIPVSEPEGLVQTVAEQGSYTPPQSQFTAPAAKEAGKPGITFGAGGGKKGSKKGLIIGAVVAVIALVALVVGLFVGNDGSDDPNLGVYHAASYTYSGMEYGVGEDWLELQSGGTVIIVMEGDEYSGTWNLDEEVLTVIQSGDTFTGTLKDGILVLDFNGMICTYVREGCELPTEAPTEPAEAEIGYWTLLRTESENPDGVMDEETVKMLQEMGMVMYVELKPDGSGELCMDEPFAITWGDGRIVADDGSEAAYTVADGYLSVVIEDMTLIFAPGETGTAVPGVTEAPTEAPTEKPTEAPTEKPTEAPTEKPTEAPTEKPTEVPTEAPAQQEQSEVGYWTLKYSEGDSEFAMDEETVEFMKNLGVEFYVELNKDGTGVFMLDDVADITWDDGKLVAGDGSSVPYTLKDGELIVEISGAKMHFVPGKKDSGTQIPSAGGEETGGPITYKAVSGVMNGMEITEAILLQMGDVTITLNGDGTGSMNFFGQVNDITYDDTTITRTGVPMAYTFEGNKMLFTMSEEIEFVLMSEDTIANRSDSDLTPDNLQYWAGDWYGWWMFDNVIIGNSDAQGNWWDCCASLAIAADGSGTLVIWDEDYGKDDPIVEIDVTVSVYEGVARIVSESGQFMGCPVGHADWLFYSDATDYEDTLGFFATYEDDECKIDCYFFLRPWGTLWDDVEAAEPGNMPGFYEEWYLPLINSGVTEAPDTIG